MNKIEKTGPGLLIGIPTLGRPINLDWAMAFKSMNPPINFNSTIHIVKGKPVDEARQEIAENAVSIGADYLFFIGDDTICPSHTLRQLLHRLANNPSVGVVGGVYCTKCDPSTPLVFRGNGRGAFWDWKIGEFFEVTGLGMDCTLIRTEVLKGLSKPWFKTVDTENYIDGENKAEAWTEDLFFFDKLGKELPQWKVYCDGSVLCQHWDFKENRFYELPQDSLPRRQLIVPKEKKRCLMVGYDTLPEECSNSEYTFVSINDSDSPCDYRVDYSNLPFDSHEFDKVIISHSVKLDILKVAELQRVQK